MISSKTKHQFLVKSSLFLIICKIVFSGAFFYTTNFQAYASGIDTETLLNCTNFFREKANLPPLILNPLLSKAGFLKIDDMDKYNYWAHTNPTTHKEPWEFLEKIKYPYATAGENLAFEYNTSEGVCEGWMNSPSHRKNLLSDKFNEVGFAVKRVDLGKEGVGNLVVQFFGSQKDQVIPEDIQNQYRYQAKSSICNSEILNKFKITSPTCGYTNNANLKIEAEIMDQNFKDMGFVINETNVHGQVLENDNNIIIIAEKDLTDGDYQIKTQTASSNETAVVSVTVDTKSPQIIEAEIKINSQISDGSFLFNIEIPINDDHLDQVTAYYTDPDGEIVSKKLHLLGDDIYHSQLYFPIDKQISDYPITITALDKSGNSNTININLYPPEISGTQAILATINYDQIWQYLLFGVIVITFTLYLIDLYIIKKSPKTKEVHHHNFVQFSIITLLLFFIISQIFIYV